MILGGNCVEVACDDPTPASWFAQNCANPSLFMKYVSVIVRFTFENQSVWNGLKRRTILRSSPLAGSHRNTTHRKEGLRNTRRALNGFEKNGAVEKFTHLVE